MRNRRSWLLITIFGAAACVDRGCDSISSSSQVLQDCAALPSQTTWTIQPRGPVTFGPEDNEIGLTVSQSRGASVWPPVAPECQTSFSLFWRVANQRVATALSGDRRDVWVTGVSTGLTRLTGQLRFSDESEASTEPFPVRVSRPEAPPPGTILLVEGEVQLNPPPPGGVGADDFRHFIPFTTSAVGRIQVVVDWISPLNRVNYVLFEGHCRSVGGCGRLILSANEDWIKPLTESSEQPEGGYTVRIDHLGPDPETIRYIVRWSPN